MHYIAKMFDQICSIVPARRVGGTNVPARAVGGTGSDIA